MKVWFIRLLERYEQWRQKEEAKLVHDLLELQVQGYMRDHCVLIVKDEHEIES